MKKRLILDTSLFVNPASGQAFGTSPTSAFIKFLELANEAAHIEFFMPPRVYSELMNFVDESRVPKKLLLIINKKSPKKHEIKVPGMFIFNLVDDIRDRVDRGLRLAERHVRESLAIYPKRPESGPASQKVRPDAEIIGSLRDSYRRIMREGMLDSRADVDLLLLGYEIDGILVSADQGVNEWAGNLGLQILAYDHLRDLLTEKPGSKSSLSNK